MKKYILWIIFILFLILCAEYIRVRYVHKHFQDTYMDYTSAIPIKEDILKIHSYLKVNDYIDQFDYLKPQYRFDQNKQVEILLHLYDNKFFHVTMHNDYTHEKFTSREYFDCLQTLIVLCNLLNSYGTLEIKEQCHNIEIFKFIQSQLTIWVLNFPRGEFIGREVILKDLCVKSFQYLYPMK